MTAAELELDLGTKTIHCTSDEIATTLGALLREMQRMIPRLRPDELVVLRRIMSHESGPITVGDLFPDFSRESETHMTLRRFRAAQFIRPARTGRWAADEPIEVKPFARLMWDRVGEEALIPGTASRAAVAPAEKSSHREKPAVIEDDVVDLLDLRDFADNDDSPSPVPHAVAGRPARR